MTLALLWAAANLAVLAVVPARAAEPDGPQALIGEKEAIGIAIQTRLAEKAGRGTDGRNDYKALLDFYSGSELPLVWVDENGLTPRAKAVIEEIGKADDYGLRASDYDVPRLSGFDSKASGAVGQLAGAEVELSLAAFRYARDARGGRMEPLRVSENLDPTLALPDAVQFMESIAIRTDAAAYLRSFQPDQPQFQALRKALIAARGGGSEPTDDGVVKIPDGPLLKVGVQDERVVLLRKRLDVPGDQPLFDEAVEEGVKRFQMEHGVMPDGLVGPGTRRLLNGGQQQQQATASPARVRLILLNMERWRWLPNDLGSFYVTVNIPEFMLRVMEDGKPAFTTRVVVGKIDKQTPIFTKEMQEIVFNPYWNVPNSIKTEELMPSIRAGGGDWLFGGGGGGYDASVFERNGLRVAIGTKEVDPSALDWSRIDIRSLNVYQPPGPTNVLGTVKFVFPNKHDVYMHDTTQKSLFAKTVRAESHGCMRVQNPDQFAITLLKKDQNWSAGQVQSTIQNSEDQHIALKEKIPVYINYFTLWVNDDGSISTFNDLYGHDARMAAALFGENVAFEQPMAAIADDFPGTQIEDRGFQERGIGERVSRQPGRINRPGNSIADSISAFINN